MGNFAVEASVLIGGATGVVSVCEAEFCSSEKPPELMRRDSRGTELMNSVSSEVTVSTRHSH